MMALHSFTRTVLRSIVLSLILVLVACTCAMADPADASDNQADKATTEAESKADKTATKAESEADKAAAEAEAAALREQANALMARIDECQDTIDKSNKAIKKAEDDYEKSMDAVEKAKKQAKEEEAHIAELQQKLESLSVELYKGHRSDNPLLGLLDAKSYIEFDEALDSIESIADEEADLIEEARQARDEIDRAEREAEAFAQKALEEKEAAIQARDEAKELYDELSTEVASIASKISDEQARHALASAVAEKIFPGDAKLKNPCPLGTKSDGFGYRDFDNAFHQGLDIAAPEGTPYFAAAPGTVVSATNDGGNNGGAGNWVVIDHGHGVVTKYMHSLHTFVKVGDIVLQGQHIGDVGETGAAYGAHLHFQVEIDGTAVDPEKVIKGKVLV